MEKRKGFSPLHLTKFDNFIAVYMIYIHSNICIVQNYALFLLTIYISFLDQEEILLIYSLDL